MEFSEVQEEELPEVGEIAKNSFDDYSKDDFFNMSHDKNYKFVVSKIDGRIVGFVIFLRIDEKVEIIKIASHPILRRRGIASGLMQYVQEYATQNGHVGVILEVNEKNVPARKLYSKLGFSEIYTRKKYYHNTDDAIIMEWNIK